MSKHRLMFGQSGGLTGRARPQQPTDEEVTTFLSHGGLAVASLPLRRQQQRRPGNRPTWAPWQTTIIRPLTSDERRNAIAAAFRQCLNHNHGTEQTAAKSVRPVRELLRARRR